jgi:hypothetical protein
MNMKYWALIEICGEILDNWGITSPIKCYFITKVSGVQFMPPGCNAKTHGTLIRHHRQVVNLKAVRWGVSMEGFVYGKMHAHGSHQPQGGRKPNIYAEYPELIVDNNKNIEAIFVYAYVSI